MSVVSDDHYVRVWLYDVAPERADAFERAYGPDGDWALLFARSDGYLGTELYRRVGPAGGAAAYLTIDRFASEQAWERFLDDYGGLYDALDEQLADLTLVERPVV